jgi:hypothetical protein
MPTTRESAAAVLANGWGRYISDFQRLSPQEQAAFLNKQGYARLGDLLAHIQAWWETGLQAIESYRRDPQARMPEIDVDSFNARAVEAVRTKSEVEIVRTFEEMRSRFVEVLEGLSDGEFKDPRILKQIEMELIGHWEDHKIG